MRVGALRRGGWPKRHPAIEPCNPFALPLSARACLPRVVRATFRFALPILLGLCASLAAAAPLCPTTHPKAISEWSLQCFEQQGDALKVKPRYLRKLRVNRAGVTLIVVSAPLDPLTLLAVGRDGTIVVPNIRHVGDFDLPNPDGIGRFDVVTRDAAGEPERRCGFYDQKTYRIIVAPTYAHCGPFHEGTGAACTDCNSYCRDEDCHDSVFTDGQVFRFDRRGTVVESRRLGRPDDECDGPGSASVERRGKNWGLLTCLRKKPVPFDRIDRVRGGAVPMGCPACDNHGNPMPYSNKGERP